MTINFSFSCSFFYTLTICLLRATMHVIDGLPSWSIILMWKLFWRGSSFDQRVIYAISISEKRLWLKGVFEKLIIFGQRAPRYQSRMTLKYHDLGILLCLKGFGRLEVAASFDAYQITKHQILQKFIFCYLIFVRAQSNFSSVWHDNQISHSLILLFLCVCFFFFIFTRFVYFG